MEDRSFLRTYVSLLTGSVVILLLTLSRLVPHPANMTPLAAVALFGGVYLPKRTALILPLVILFISDLVLGFHQSMPYVYASFILTSCIGIYLQKKKTVPSIFLASITSSVLFFLITNFGFWLHYSLYAKTLAGQFEAYSTALPFFRNTLLGDLFYTTLFFGTYELATWYGEKLPSLKRNL